MFCPICVGATILGATGFIKLYKKFKKKNNCKKCNSIDLDKSKK